MKRFLYLNFKIYYNLKTRFIRRFTPAGMLVLCGTGLSALLGINTYKAMAFQIFTFLLCLLLTALVCSRFFKPRLNIERILPRFATAGTPFTYTLVVKNPAEKPEKSLSLIEDIRNPCPDFQTFVRTPEPGENFRNYFDRKVGFYRWEWLINRNALARFEFSSIPDINPKGQAVVETRIEPRDRGVIQFTGVTVTRPDPFGLWNACVSIPLSQSLTVLPKRYPLPPFRLPGIRRHHAGGIALTSSVGDSDEFISMRDYRPGDPLRRIHWKSWAKTGKPVVKEYQGEYFVRHALILDTFQQAAYSEAFEEAVSVAASFACTVQTQESLLDLMFVGTQAFCFTAGRGLGQTDRLLEILASVRPTRDKPFTDLSALVLERSASLSVCICVLLDWDDARKDFIGKLRARETPVIVIVIGEPSAQRKELPNLGPMSDMASNFLMLETGKIAEGLARLV
jgi:uncharacterized protein (DUF58 family)